MSPTRTTPVWCLSQTRCDHSGEVVVRCVEVGRRHLTKPRSGSRHGGMGRFTPPAERVPDLLIGTAAMRCLLHPLQNFQQNQCHRYYLPIFHTLVACLGRALSVTEKNADAGESWTGAVECRQGDRFSRPIARAVPGGVVTWPCPAQLQNSRSQRRSVLTPSRYPSKATTLAGSFQAAPL